MKKRGYSRDFRTHGDTGKRYLLDAIPAGLWRAVREKAKRKGVSVRALILSLLAKWVKGDQDIDRAAFEAGFECNSGTCDDGSYNGGTIDDGYTRYQQSRSATSSS